ncbi:MFS transporter [Nesterenkonia suensis]
MTDRPPESSTSVASPADEQPQVDSPEPQAATESAESAESTESTESAESADEQQNLSSPTGDSHQESHHEPHDANTPAEDEAAEDETAGDEAAEDETAESEPAAGIEPDAEFAGEPEREAQGEGSPGGTPEGEAPPETPGDSATEPVPESDVRPEPSADEPPRDPGPTPTGRIRLSRPTPTLPPESLPEEKDTSLSDFFDTLDARVAEATGRLADAFRRPEPGEQISARVDYRLFPDQSAEPESVAPDDPEFDPQVDARFDPQVDAWDGSADDEGPSAEAPAASDPEELPDRLDDESPDDVDLPDEESASQLNSYPSSYQDPHQDPYQEETATRPSHPAPEISPDTESTMISLPPVDAQTGDPRTSRVALPGPPRDPRQSLPWEVREQQAEEARQQDASAARRRAVILEKASAIEAATGRDEPDPDEFADEEEDLYTYIPPYNLPSRHPDPEPRGLDLARQIFVSISAMAAVASAAWMLGAFTGPTILGGNGLDHLVDGWYAGGRALLTPDAGHYWLWPFIVLGLLGHAVHQWTTTQISTPRQRRSGWLVGLASVLMLVWTAAVHAGLLSVAVLAALAAALALVDAVRQFTLHTARNAVERRLTDSVVGLFAGWALVGAMSSISALLTAMSVRIPGFPALLWALIGLVVCIWIGAYYAMTERGRMTIALGLGWGMFWLIFPRVLSETPSLWVAIGAAMGAFIVILATESRRHRINHAERRAAMGRPVDDII